MHECRLHQSSDIESTRNERLESETSAKRDSDYMYDIEQRRKELDRTREERGRKRDSQQIDSLGMKNIPRPVLSRRSGHVFILH